MHSGEILDICEVIYYLPALPLTLYIAFKHGFSREAGWYLLTILALCRLVGATTGIAAVYKPSTGLIIASLITSTMGSTTLVAAMTGIVNRVNASSGKAALPARITKLIHLMSIAAVVLAINGGIKISDSDPSTRDLGYLLIKIALIFILVQYLATVAVALRTWGHARLLAASEQRLLTLCCIAMPFVFVRVVYSLCAAFDHNSSAFSMLSATLLAVILRAVLGFAMEVVSVTIFIIAGFTAPKILKAKEGTVSEDLSREQMTKVEDSHGSYSNGRV